ncbi:hypothetical protein I317_01838 [Kwoniella heveanensis CBS 569]|uniref:Nuclear speckle splicing regulatory protein 1 N-terminal domain-containing protein n=1 Tax=Kwoniella heveanensis BCC8398 TaxID=1296120 RepID=A0A1B9GYF4_9TREE|nr:hypothetical protein I316_01939 [Kwoniella heveanensis BCC8398]OCF44220.1 hypothetical protein I317_01838 [Kwoniella heveanensis CBS 569]
MASNGAKLSFAFAASSSSGAGPSKKAAGVGAGNPLQAAGSLGAPKSNLELLMARSKAGGSLSNSAGAKLSSSSSSKPQSSRPLLFDEDEDEDANENVSATAGPSNPHAIKANRKAQAPVGQTNLLSRSERRAKEAAEAIDQSIFDYDTHYDKMKSAERAIEQSKKQEAEERKPKYIENFLASAQTRRLDKLRAEEKALAREREKEGDEFEGKEKFVTEGYKKQMEEVRKAEEEEKAREEAMRKSKSGPGLTSFYKTMLDSDEAKHAAAVAATSGPSSVAQQGPSLAIRPPTTSGPQREEDTRDIYDDEEEYDPLLAREAKTASAGVGPSFKSGSGGEKDDPTGKDKNVEINDNGEIVDKRSLLKAGLNIMKKPKPILPNSLLTSQRSSGNPDGGDGPYKSRAVGTAASYGERMERERKRLADQVKAEAERKRAQEEERLRREEEEAKKRREGDKGEAERKRNEARERYLARKRQREEESKNEAAKKAKEGEEE